MTTPRGLATLEAEQAIRDVIHGLCRLLDDHCWDRLDDFFHDSAIVRYSIRPAHQGYRDWGAAAAATMRSLDGTRHQIGNLLIDIDGDVASSESYVTASHRVPATAPSTGYWTGSGAPYLGVAGGRYIDHFVRQGGLWKVTSRVTLIEWRIDIPLG